MATIENDDIKHLAALCALGLDDSEIDSLRTDIEQIINYIDQLSELDTDGVEPTYQVTGLANVWRDDKIESSVATEELVILAKSSDNNSVKVPKVL